MNVWVGSQKADVTPFCQNKRCDTVPCRLTATRAASWWQNCADDKEKNQRNTRSIHHVVLQAAGPAGSFLLSACCYVKGEAFLGCTSVARHTHTHTRARKCVCSMENTWTSLLFLNCVSDAKKFETWVNTGTRWNLIPGQPSFSLTLAGFETLPQHTESKNLSLLFRDM